MQTPKKISNVKNGKEMLGKLNSLIESYAELHNLTEYVYSVELLIDNTDKKGQLLVDFKSIDIKEKFLKDKGEIYKNNPFNKDIPLNEIINSYAENTFPDFIKIKEFLRMLFYGLPRNVKKEDFNEINNIYKKIKRLKNEQK